MTEPFISVHHIIQKFQLSANKILGQNYLCDKNILRKIACINGSLKGHHVLEIGCGPGGLSQMLLNNETESLYIIEKDKRFIEASQEWRPLFQQKITIEQADILQKDLYHLPQPHPDILFSNLPYNITSDFLLKIISYNNMYTHFKHITLLLQKDVVQRFISQPKTKNYGRMSVLIQLTHIIVEHFNLPPHLFIPAPKVMSCLVTLIPKQNHPSIPLDTLSKITHHFFSQRRKKISHLLKGLFNNSNEISEELGLNPHTRPEELSPQDYLALAIVYDKKNTKQR